MGRHGGGSSGGGFHFSGGHGGHGGSGGFSSRISHRPFKGCYNRCYTTRAGRRIRCYSDDKSLGTSKRAYTKGAFGCIITILLFYFYLFKIPFYIVNWGSKLNGNIECIRVMDNIDILTPEEETKTLELFEKVYSKSGMPITLVTEDFEWKEDYSSLEILSEEMYYSMNFGADGMIILFTADTDGQFVWEYDMYCGDATIKCFSDNAFNALLRKFQRRMSRGNLYEALDYSWNSVMFRLGKPSINWMELIHFLLFLFPFSIVFIPELISTKRLHDAYMYFRENPNELSDKPMELYSECPSCGAANTFQDETCLYCGTSLKLTDEEAKNVKPKQ